ncbi:energy-coupling factor ABC transporter permease [Dehalococcoidia bacterium]|nr:energy-coupling factor ABC transporter permease [Dehalococcoidia bacterium]
MANKTIHRIKSHLVLALVFALGLIFLYPSPAHAMHIAEGILPVSWAVVWFVIAFGFIAVGIRLIGRRTREVRGLMPLLGLTGAAIFLISLISVPVPIPGTCAHPCGTPLAAILVGPFISAVLGAIALLLHALFLGHGGISTWGANIVSMAVLGSFVAFGTFLLLRRFNAPIAVTAFAAGLFGNLATYITTSFQLASALHGPGLFWSMFGATIVAYAPVQGPVAVVEGLITAAVILVVHRRRPEILSHIMSRGSNRRLRTK